MSSKIAIRKMLVNLKSCGGWGVTRVPGNWAVALPLITSSLHQLDLTYTKCTFYL